MGSITKQVHVDSAPDVVWDAVRDFGALHERLVRGFVVATELDGRDRIVTFGNGMVQREPLVALDDDQRRLVYSATGSLLGATHYNAAVQVAAGETGGSTISWVIDFLPDEIAPALDQAMERGADAMRATLGPRSDS